MDFAFADLDYLLERSDLSGFRIALTVHDVMPIVVPQYFTLDLEGHFLKTIRVSDVLLVNSDCTRRDLERFATAQNIDLPIVQKIPLASGLLDLEPVRPDLPPGIVEGDFVIVVGTISARKNHHLILDVWDMMNSDEGLACVPKLVVAGARGTVSEETVSRLTRDPLLKASVHYVENATDREIAWLYRHCAFTVFPSLYEGWGLPVSESLDFGKMCIASNRASLLEAGEGLVLHLDPYDRLEWRAAILHLWQDRSGRRAAEAQIRERHHRVTPSEVAAAVLEAVLNVP